MDIFCLPVVMIELIWTSCDRDKESSCLTRLPRSAVYSSLSLPFVEYTNCFPWRLTISLFLLIISRLRFLLWKLSLWFFFGRIEMWASSVSPSNLSLIGLSTTEIYNRTGITGNTDRQTHRQTDIHTDWIWYSPHIGYRIFFEEPRGFSILALRK